MNQCSLRLNETYPSNSCMTAPGTITTTGNDSFSASSTNWVRTSKWCNRILVSRTRKVELSDSGAYGDKQDEFITRKTPTPTSREHCPLLCSEGHNHYGAVKMIILTCISTSSLASSSIRWRVACRWASFGLESDRISSRLQVRECEFFFLITLTRRERVEWL